MTDAHTLLEQYISAHSKGEAADPREWLERVPEGRERAKLEALIDAYLAARPDARVGPGGLPRLGAGAVRRAGQQRALLAGRELAGGAARRCARRRGSSAATSSRGWRPPSESRTRRTKVGSYYHEMEHGLLPSEGVDDKVLDALGSILGQSAEALRRAGEAFRGGEGAVAASARSVVCPHRER